jgi:hypothetical protein
MSNQVGSQLLLRLACFPSKSTRFSCFPIARFSLGVLILRSFYAPVSRSRAFAVGMFYSLRDAGSAIPSNKIKNSRRLLLASSLGGTEQLIHRASNWIILFAHMSAPNIPQPCTHSTAPSQRIYRIAAQQGKN